MGAALMTENLLIGAVNDENGRTNHVRDGLTGEMQTVPEAAMQVRYARVIRLTEQVLPASGKEVGGCSAGKLRRGIVT